MSETKFMLYGYLLMHNGARRDLEAIEKQAARQVMLETAELNKLQQRFSFYWNIIEEHHLTEDNGFFPQLINQEPALAKEFKELTGEHHVIDALVAAMKDTLQAAITATTGEERQEAYGVYLSVVREMRKRMNAHLDREEALVIPAVCRIYSEAEQVAMEEAIMGAMPEAHMAMMLPWMLDNLDPEERAVAYMQLPPPVQHLLDTAWKPRYEEVTYAFAG